MTWARCVAVSGLALALAGAWSSVRAQPDVPASGKVEVGGRTSTKLKPQHTLHVDAGASTPSDAGAPAVDAAPVPAPPPMDDLPPANEIPPPPEKVSEPQQSRAPGMRGYGRKDPLMPHVRLDGHVALSWDGAFGVGVRADWLLIEGTFKYSQRDELAVSAGADVTFVRFDGAQVVEVYPTAVLQWSIGVSDRLYLYPEFGFVGHVDDGRWDGLFPNIGFGTRYYFARSLGMHARFGWPIAFSAGAVF
jgi:hypothetical protein